MTKHWNKKAKRLILKRFSTTDEAWFYCYDPTIKQQSSEWKHPSSPTLMKAKTVKSAAREKEAPIASKWLHIASYCPTTYCSLNFAYVSKTEILRKLTIDVAQQNNVEILPHPPYSPDLTPCDIWMFPQLQKPLRGKRFASN
ncbi:hypothetical protein TNCV_4466501 [Trichonephila clavipes]|nr:hypothetical protein TNCV_4466501 [Trichonephila clavipes]